MSNEMDAIALTKENGEHVHLPTHEETGVTDKKSAMNTQQMVSYKV
jgi:hypothetical protein